MDGIVQFLGKEVASLVLEDGIEGIDKDFKEVVGKSQGTMQLALQSRAVNVYNI